MHLSHLTTLAPLLSSALAASGSFNVLSFNVAVLPEFINDNGIKGGKENAATMIGQRFAQYAFDVIQVQEDFDYHEELYAADNHPFRTKTFGGVPFGSGLNTLANFGWSDYRRITWDDCYIDKGDCLTPKGFTFMRMNPVQGVEIDFYNLHADAGSGNDDEAARRSNIQQVADYIGANSAGRAVVVFGDTNTLYSRPTDNVRIFGGQNGLTDAWVQFQYGGVIPGGVPECPEPTTDNSCETLDKVLYRRGSAVTLSATAFDYVTDLFLQADGSILSDHNAVLVDFAQSTV
ncbi:Sphingomyelinase [Fulvia fulva]|uniref:Sphingomyelinase n=1 Tax=Passalora fulva TaxID=5499 RepID=A0A9Q8P6T8_PASFU|nr:Sphingomyelinase [Fulvia fulva]KAK4628700.1 Sphingomyelinase [Fulvia fulva]KAK4630195.1 Sphingomyelinase [Fulvia fulva]UJO15182.1 Sphingomyelinase [Fulvia fulva]WPV12803.1 Sphingomyelinase [Fulvia fulva]WPV27777.1 Sphingomyelinase [Fulvia fulva]